MEDKQLRTEIREYLHINNCVTIVKTLHMERDILPSFMGILCETMVWKAPHTTSAKLTFQDDCVAVCCMNHGELLPSTCSSIERTRATEGCSARVLNISCNVRLGCEFPSEISARRNIFNQKYRSLGGVQATGKKRKMGPGYPR